MSRRDQTGLSYVEALLAAVLVTIALLPALEALQTAVTGTRVAEMQSMDWHRLTGRLETVLAEPFAELDAAAVNAGSPATPSSYSDPPGTAGRILVFLARYDGDDADSDGNPFTGGDAGLLWLRAELEGRPVALETLRAQ